MEAFSVGVGVRKVEGGEDVLDAHEIVELSVKCTDEGTTVVADDDVGEAERSEDGKKGARGGLSVNGVDSAGKGVASEDVNAGEDPTVVARSDDERATVIDRELVERA